MAQTLDKSSSRPFEGTDATRLHTFCLSIFYFSTANNEDIAWMRRKRGPLNLRGSVHEASTEFFQELSEREAAKGNLEFEAYQLHVKLVSLISISTLFESDAIRKCLEPL